jgi:hypothetical protein
MSVGVTAASFRQQAKRRELFRLAQARNDECDAERARAIRILFRYLHLLNRAKKVDRQLEDLIKCLRERCFRSKDPVKAWEKLTAWQRRRGPKVKNDDRDFDIAVTIERKLWVWVWVWVWCKRRLRLRLDREKGKNLEEAIAEVASVEELKESPVRKIYYAQRKKHTELGILVEASFVEEQAGFPPKPTSVRRSLRSGARIKIR